MALQRLLLAEDPFDRDNLWMRFIGQASEFAQARGALLTLALSDEERALLRHQSELTALAVPIQERVVRLIWDGRHVAAQRLLVDEAIPAQDRVLEQLKQLYRMQEQEAAEAASQFTRDSERARQWLLAIAGAILVITLTIAMLVVRQTRRAEDLPILIITAKAELSAKDQGLTQPITTPAKSSDPMNSAMSRRPKTIAVPLPARRWHGYRLFVTVRVQLALRQGKIPRRGPPAAGNHP